MIRGLGTHLTDVDETRRANACLLLADTLERAPRLVVAPRTTRHVMEFLAARLKDFPSLDFILRSAIALTKRAASSDVEIFFRALVERVNVSDLKQATRQRCYQFLSLALTHHADDLSADDVASGIATCVEGEKDPRCLRVCFDLLRRALSLPSARAAEEIFDVASCYFPISFTPPPNDTYGITKEELVMGLRRVFAGSEAMGPHVVPALIEHLAGDAPSAAIVDALRTLTFCVETRFDVATLSPHLAALSDALRDRVNAGSDEDVVNESLRAIGVVGRAVASARGGEKRRRATPSTNTTTRSFAWTSFVDPLLNECARELSDGKTTDTMLANRAVDVVRALARSSRKLYDAVIARFVPLLHRKLDDETYDETTLRMIVQLLESGDVADIVYVADREESTHPLRANAKTLLRTFRRAIGHSIRTNDDSSKGVGSAESVCNWSVAGIRAVLVEPPNLLVSPTDLEDAVQSLTDVVAADTTNRSHRVAVDALRAIGRKFTAAARIIERVTLEVLFDRVERRDDVDGARRALDALSALYALPTLFEIVVPRLSSFVIAKTTTSGVVSGFTTDASRATPIDAVSVLRALSVADDETIDRFVLWNLNTPPLAVALLRAFVADDDVGTNRSDLVRCAVGLMETVMTRASAEARRTLLDEATTLLLRTEKKNDARRDDMLPVLTAVVGSANRHVVVSSERSEALRRALARLSVRSEAAAMCLAARVNKMSKGDAFDTFLTTHVMKPIKRACTRDDEEDEDDDGRTRAFVAFAWITKALLLRGHTSATDMTIELCTAASNMSLLPIIADILACPVPSIMSRACGGRVRVLWTQRLFDLYVTRFGSDPRTRGSLAMIAQHMPLAVIRAEISTVFPLMLVAFDEADGEGKLAALRAISSLLRPLESSDGGGADDIVSVVKTHVSALIKHLLRLATCDARHSVRSLSVQCLDTLCVMPVHVLYPHKDHVFRGLRVVLDDEKRCIRQRAVRCRNRWAIVKRR